MQTNMETFIRSGELDAVRAILRQLVNRLDESVQHEILDHLVESGQSVVNKNTADLTKEQAQMYSAGYSGTLVEVTHDKEGYMRDGITKLEDWQRS